MAARKTPNAKKPGGKSPPKYTPTAQAKKLAQQGKAALTASYGTGEAASAGMKAVMDYYNSLPRAQRQAQYAMLAKTINSRDLSNWSGDPGNIALHGEIAMEARRAYSAANGPRGSGSGGTATPDAAASGSFVKGVSGTSGQFITEAGQSSLEAGEAEEGGPTKDRKKQKAKARKLSKRAVKKTNVKGKAIRKALRSEGITKSDKRVYKKVAKQSTPKLSSRLRVADRRNDRKGK